MLQALKAVERSTPPSAAASSEPDPSLSLSSRRAARHNAASYFSKLETLQATASGATERKSSLHLNVPCVVQGCSGGFESATRCWLECGRINEGYFREQYGELRVPLKLAPSSRLDADGRAEDLVCINVTMLEWLDEYRFHPDKHYLKDFHLITSLPSSSSASDLYSLPSFAKTDMLNPFLAAYDGGDYKFVYWGPEGSATGLHSDVANTFSWSYNVVGEKEWVFYNPSEESRQVKLTQRSGEASS